MPKKQHVIPIPDGNAVKYFSYREAWGRIKKAIAHGFYLEAVTLEESIVSDRLISYLVQVGALEAENGIERKNFNELILKWRKQVPEPINDKHFTDLQTSVNEWRVRRNRVVHGMVKSAPGTNHQDIIDFKREAELVARQGYTLANSVCNWHKKIKKQS